MSFRGQSRRESEGSRENHYGPGQYEDSRDRKWSGSRNRDRRQGRPGQNHNWHRSVERNRDREWDRDRERLPEDRDRGGTYRDRTSGGGGRNQGGSGTSKHRSNRGSQQRNNGSAGGRDSYKSNRRGFSSSSGRKGGGGGNSRPSPSSSNGRRNDQTSRDYQSRSSKGSKGTRDIDDNAGRQQPRSSLHSRERSKYANSDSSGDSTPGTPSSNSSTDMMVGRRERRAEVKKPLTPVSDDEWGGFGRGGLDDEATSDRHTSRSRSRSQPKLKISAGDERGNSLGRSGMKSDSMEASQRPSGIRSSHHKSGHSSSEGELNSFKNDRTMHIPKKPLKKRGRERSRGPSTRPAARMPEPTNLTRFRKTDSPVMKGELNQTNGKLIIRGKWAMSYKEYCGGGVKSEFMYALEDCTQIPQTGRYTGWFKMHEGSKKITYPEKNVFLSFEKNTQGSYNLKGSGKNQFGSFQLTGSYTPSPNDVVMYRAYVSSFDLIPKDFKYDPSREAEWQNPSQIAANPPAVIQDPPPTQIPQQDRESNQKKSFIGITKLREFVQKLFNFDTKGVFHDPVDPVALNCPQYLDHIKHPMDLGTIRKKIRDKAYEDKEEVLLDLKLMCDNSLYFNKDENCPVRKFTLAMDKKYKSSYKKIFRVTDTELAAILARASTPLSGQDSATEIKASEKQSIPDDGFNEPKRKRIKKESRPITKKSAQESIDPIKKANEAINQARIQVMKSQKKTKIKEEVRDIPPDVENDSEEEAEFTTFSEKRHRSSKPPVAKLPFSPELVKEKPRIPIQVPPEPEPAPEPEQEQEPARVPEPQNARAAFNMTQLTFEENAELTYVISEEIPVECTADFRSYLENLCPLSVDEERLNKVVELIQNSMPEIDTEEEVEIENLPIATLRNVQRMVNQFQKDRGLKGLTNYKLAKRRAKEKAASQKKPHARDQHKLKRKLEPDSKPAATRPAVIQDEPKPKKPRSSAASPISPDVSSAPNAALPAAAASPGPTTLTDDILGGEGKVSVPPRRHSPVVPSDNQSSEDEGQEPALSSVPPIHPVAPDTKPNPELEKVEEEDGVVDDEPDEPEVEEPIPKVNELWWKNFRANSTGIVLRSDSSVVLNDLWLSAKKERQENIAIETEKKKQDQLRLEYERWLRQQEAEKVLKQKQVEQERKAIEERRRQVELQKNLEKLARKRKEERVKNLKKVQEVDLFESHKAIEEFSECFGIDQKCITGFALDNFHEGFQVSLS